MALRTQLRPACAPDANLELQASVTKVASFSSAVIDLGAQWASIDTPQVVVYISAIASAGTAEEYTFALHQSNDNFAADDELIGSSKTPASAASGDLAAYIKKPFVFNTNQIDKRYIRLKVTIAGTAPSVTYESFLGANH